MNQPPKSFLPGPGGFRPPQAQSARVVQVPALPPAPPAAAIVLTVSRADRRVLLPKALVRALHLAAGQRLDLVPPPRRGGLWLLDTASRTGLPVRLRPDGKAWLTLVHHLGPEHFHRPNPGTTGTAATARVLTLHDEDPARPGVYFLSPD